MGIRYDQLSGPFKAAVDAALARDGHSIQEPDRQTTPRSERNALPALVHIAGPLLIRIVRRVPHSRRLDDDNLSGGCKQLRDAIATSLGRKGDSEEDGLWWEYAQEKGSEEYETLIEIFGLTD